jgi:hypothetical protein
LLLANRTMSARSYSWQPPHFGQTTLAFLSAISFRKAEKTWPQPLHTRFTLSSLTLKPHASPPTVQILAILFAGPRWDPGQREPVG